MHSHYNDALCCRGDRLVHLHFHWYMRNRNQSNGELIIEFQITWKLDKPWPLRLNNPLPFFLQFFFSWAKICSRNNDLQQTAIFSPSYLKPFLFLFLCVFHVQQYATSIIFSQYNPSLVFLASHWRSTSASTRIDGGTINPSYTWHALTSRHYLYI